MAEIWLTKLQKSILDFFNIITFPFNMTCYSYIIFFIIFWPVVGSLSSNYHNIYGQIKKKIPKPSKFEPLEVKTGFYIESMGHFRSTEMSFDMDLYLYMSWIDPKMAHNESDYILINDKKVLDRMWLPDLYFANAKTSHFHEVTVPNFNMYVNNAGVISFGTRVTLNVACNLNLKNYPLDQQLCYVKIISYAYTTNEMNVTWFDGISINYNSEIGLPELRIVSIKPGYCDGTYTYTITQNSSRVGQFSCLLGLIKLERSIGYHLVQTYLPTALIVMISWVSFWIDRRAVPARVSLSFTTLLILSTQGNGLRYGLPPVSYAKAIDYWYGVCMLFIFGVLLEFALVNSYMRCANKYNNLAQSMEQISMKSFRYSFVDDSGSYNYKPDIAFKAAYFNQRALRADKISRIVFPTLFVVFNVIYWSYYLKYSKEEVEIF